MAEPANQKLWDVIVAQAKSKFRVYPSPAAAHFVHKTYVEHGGQFTEGKNKRAKSGRRR
jgi:hypothetical protein